MQKEVPFVFYDDCVEAFEILKKALISAPIVQPPDWNLPFEIMCDASDYAMIRLQRIYNLWSIHAMFTIILYGFGALLHYFFGLTY